MRATRPSALLLSASLGLACATASVRAQCTSAFSAPPTTPAVAEPQVPAAAAGAITGLRGGNLALTSWRFWWELNKDRFLDLPRGNPQQRGLPADVTEALQRTLKVSTQRDLTAASLLALAKICLLYTSDAADD